MAHPRPVLAAAIAACLAAALAIAVPAAPARAQELPPEPGADRSVAIFFMLCLNALPDRDAVRRMAEAGGFEPLEGAALAAYRPAAGAREVYAWRFTDFETPYVLSLSASDPDAELAASTPEFAQADISGCSLYLGDRDVAEEVAAGMSARMGRAPDDGWEEPPFSARYWGGRSETMLVHIYYWSPASGAPGGLLSATTLVKP